MSELDHHIPDTILKPALELLACTGYAGTSMRQLAARCGLLPGSLYHHIASKQDLLFTVLLSIITERQNAWKSWSQGRDLRGCLRFLFEQQHSRPEESQVLRYEIRHLEAHNRKIVDRELGRLYRPLEHLVESNDSCCPTPSHTTLTVHAILAMIEATAGLYQEVGLKEWEVSSHLLHMSQQLLARPCCDDMSGERRRAAAIY